MFSKRGLDGKKASIDDWLTEERFFPDFVFSDQFVDTSKVDEQKAMQKLFATGKINLEEKFALFEKLEDKMSGFIKICGV